MGQSMIEIQDINNCKVIRRKKLLMESQRPISKLNGPKAPLIVPKSPDQNLGFAIKKLQKQVHSKDVKLRSYTFSNKVWLNSKYIKTKQNCKLKSKFFNLFQVLYPVKKQA